jgi:TonB family protein
VNPRLAICAAASVLGHYVLAEALSTLPPRQPPVIEHKIEIRVVAPPEPPPPEPIKPPEPVPEAKPEPEVHVKPTPHPVQATVHDMIPKDTPIAEHAVIATESTAQPVFGVSMESTSQGGGPPMPVGNTTQPQPGPAAPGATVKPLAAPVAAYEVTKMPLPQGRCTGKYTEAARTASLEGTVVLDLIVDEKGRARDIKVVEGLAHGLTEAAIAALKECQFAPGEKDGAPVAVRVRGFKIRFVMQDAQ